ncbi:hypothetical protein VMCG_10250 [Cytospora schulzeri]|uniref:Uncharacterized protein n=1 Tax=Cytospora schulzeri TaxID=448051 RepID=A0A423VH37_9PEZI|nr:hypothetical protein VMCG_10250 [Valsa malicola]
MDDHANAEPVRGVIYQRIARYQILFFDCMTPLLKKELNNAISVHSDVLQLPQLKSGDLNRILYQIADLDTLDDRLMDHWTKVHGNLVSRAALLLDICLFQMFLTAKLLEDYMGKSYNAVPWVLGQANVVEQHSAGTANDGSKTAAYQVHIIYPVEELSLNRIHVENKLKAAAARQQHPGGDIQRLIDQCDWPNLATALINDRELAAELFQQTPLNPECFNANTGKKVLLRIDEVTAKYFTQLTSSSIYTLSKQAIHRSARRGSSTTDPTTPDILRYKEEPALVAGAKSLYDRLANGLRLGGTSTKLRSLAHTASSASLDEKSRLMGAGKRSE